MFDYIKGKITVINAQYIVLENNNIGYMIKTPNPFSFKTGEEMIIYIYTHIRENIFDLYGFKTQKERSLFLDLISVKGIGPKTALAIIASSTPDEVIQAICNKNIKYLQQFPGIGPKASQQIILDLMGKLKTNDTKPMDSKIEIVYEALTSLGYTHKEIQTTIPILNENLELQIEELVRLALRKLKVFK